jgi:DNA-binding transcriptional LysR family regulator
MTFDGAFLRRRRHFSRSFLLNCCVLLLISCAFTFRQRLIAPSSYQLDGMFSRTGTVIDLNDFRYFVEVVDRGGFSAASRTLERPVSTMSYRVQKLEKELGLTLLVRTSRSIALTEAGEEFYSHAVVMLERAEEAEFAMRGRSTEAIGTVRYTVATGLAQFAMPEMVFSFLALYPKINIVQHASNDIIDIVAARYDLAIRAHSGALPDSTLVQKPLADAPWHLFASPTYLDTTGRPSSPEELRGLSTLFMKRDNVPAVWRMRSEEDPSHVVPINLKPRVYGSCMLTLKRAAEARVGIVALPAYICEREIFEGRLERVLPRWIAGDSTISALVPNRKGMSAAVRAFVDHITEAFPRTLQLSSTSRSVGRVSNIAEVLERRPVGLSPGGC